MVDVRTASVPLKSIVAFLQFYGSFMVPARTALTTACCRPYVIMRSERLCRA